MSNDTPIKRKIISRKRPCSTPHKRDKVVKYDVSHSNVDSRDIQDLWNDSSFLTDDDLLKITDQTPAKVTALQQKQELIEDSLNDSDAAFFQQVLSMECFQNNSKSSTPIPTGSNASERRDTTSSEVVTPTSRKASSYRISLKDRLKITLSDNKNAPSPINKSYCEKALVIAEAKKAAMNLVKNDDICDVGPFYGLPSKVQQLLQKHRGISKLYDWQDECLTMNGVQQGRNLIYSLPTSGGKTLVAEILIMREIVCKRKDAILILPYVAIVQEKVRTINLFALEMDFLVEEYAGSKGSFPPKKRLRRNTLFICTIEKAHSLVNSLLETQKLQRIGLIVIDELHMIGDGGGRGATLEMTLTKVMHKAKEIQLVGMSATLGNISDLCSFLNAEVYTNNFRPVALREYIKLEKQIYKINNQAKCVEEVISKSRVINFPYSDSQKTNDPDQICGLVQEVIPENSCLVFCATKKNCENVATLICKMLPKKYLSHKVKEKRALISALLEAGNGKICPVLRYTLQYGVAYHHSGLTTDERKLLEEAYTDLILCAMCCTSTLAAGVNLPAKRVILRSPYIAANFLSRSRYKQMIGRAGRAGIDTSGESILIIQQKDKPLVEGLLHSPYDVCHSSLLYEEKKGLRALLLSAIGLQITVSLPSVHSFLRRTLYYKQHTSQPSSVHEGEDLLSLAQDSLQQLQNLNLVNIDNDVLSVTALGRAVFKGPIDIDRGPQLYADLKKAQSSLVVDNFLHLLYLVTPYDLVDKIEPKWMIYMNEMSRLSEFEQRSAGVIGVSEVFVTKKAMGQRSKKTQSEFIMKRFYLTLILYDLWKQNSLWSVASKFDVPRGFIQNLLNSAGSFAVCVAHFCQELDEFWAYQDLLATFVKRLSYCTSIELIPLMEIPGVKIGRARQLYNSGYKSLKQVAYADAEILVKSIDHMPRRIAYQIIASAKMLLNDQVETLREQAEEMAAKPEQYAMAHQSTTSTQEGTIQYTTNNNLSSPVSSTSLFSDSSTYSDRASVT